MDTHVGLREAIGATWFGRALSADAREHLATLGQLREAEPGEVLLTEGGETRELDLLLRGRVAVTAHEPGQGTVTLMTVEPGDIVGWSVLLPPLPATATVRVVERATFVAFPGDALRAALATDPALSAAIHHQALDAVARRLSATRHQLLDLAQELASRSRTEPW